VKCSRCSKTAEDPQFRTCEACREFRREQARRRRNSDRAADREYRRRWRARNRDKANAYQRRWYASHREQARENSNRRRALQRESAVGSFSLESLRARLSMYRGCWICGTPNWSTVDHVKPLSKGGPHILANLRPACSRCNKSKGAKWPFPA